MIKNRLPPGQLTCVVIEFGLHGPSHLLILHRSEEYKTILYHVLEYLPGVIYPRLFA